jgi:hypothetical protein
VWRSLSTSPSDIFQVYMPFIPDLGGMDYFQFDGLMVSERKAEPPHQLPRVESFATGSAEGCLDLDLPEKMRGGTGMKEACFDQKGPALLMRDGCEAIHLASQWSGRSWVIGRQVAFTSRDLDHLC